MSEDKKLSKREAAEIRLANQYAKYQKATATAKDMEDLLRAGMIDSKMAGAYAEESKASERPPEIVKGLTRLATWIADVYKLACSKQTIKNWQKEVPPFPAAVSADYRYKWAEVAAWVEAHKVAPMKGTRFAELSAALEPARLENELDRIKFDQKMRDKELGLLVEKEEALRAGDNLAAKMNGIITNWLDLRLRFTFEAKLKERPIDPPLTDTQRARLLEIFCELGGDVAGLLRNELKDGLLK